jgi:hypothetical protein
MSVAFRLYSSGRKPIRKYARPLLARHLFQKPFGGQARRVLFVYFPSNIGTSQIFPFFYYKDILETRYNVEFRALSLPELVDSDRGGPRGADVVLLQTWYALTDDEKAAIFGKLSEHHPGAKLVYLDWCAPVDLRLADFLDDKIALYVKKQVFRDFSQYRCATLGDTNLVDHYAKRYGLSFATVRHEPPSGFREKLLIGPGFFTAHNLLPGFRSKAPPGDPRPIDLNARIRASSTDWYGMMRRDAFEAAASIKGHRVVTEFGLSWRQYLAELRRSKLCFSPFGYGEVCWRDYEAMMTGSLLLKPDVSHLVTDPDVFVPGETYVPLAWDFSDLADKVDYYVRHEDERRTIAENAFNVIHRYLTEGRFADFAGRIFAS